MAIQARTEFASALNQVCSERGLEPEVVIESIKQAILAAYRKDYGEPDDIEVGLNEETGEITLTKKKKVVTPPGFGRIAAQTAKQVILQRIREAEKNAILEEYSSKIDTNVSGMVQRISGPVITVNLGKAEGIMPPQEQAQEKYFVNQRLKFYVVGIKEGTRGEEIIVSRSSNELLKGLFKQEVPEINSGAVEIKKVAREAGSRSKIAVFSDQMGVDPVGSCVGQKGVRVQAVINELGDEKIDVIAYQEDPVEFIKSALSPAQDIQVKVDEKEKIAEVTAPDDQLSLAIGKEGQNVRLAAKLTGYKIDIRGKSGSPKEVEAKEKAAQEEAKKALGVTSENEEVTEDPLRKQTEVSEPRPKGRVLEKKLVDINAPKSSSKTDKMSAKKADKRKSRNNNLKSSTEDGKQLINEKEEKKEKTEAKKVAKEIKSVKGQNKNESQPEEEDAKPDKVKSDGSDRK